MKIFATRRIIGLDEYRNEFDWDVWEDELPPSPEALRAKAQGCAGLVTMLSDRIDAALLDSLPTLKVISQYAVGVNNIDLAAAKARRIQVGNTPDVLTDATADLAFALLMSSARHIVPGCDYVKAGRWKTWGPTLFMGSAVWGATLGVVGYGRIGQAMARRGKGFAMRVLVSSEHLTPEDAARDGVEAASLETVLRESDFVSLHTPLSPATHHLIGAQELALMKPIAILINAARGEIVDPQALFEALKTGRPGFAALDVTEPEPLPADHPLLSLPNCLVVPHLGSATRQARLAMTRLVIANLRAGLNGDPLPHLANP